MDGQEARGESLREQVLETAYARYGTQAEYPWGSSPNFAVLRHAGNRKWYAVIMDVPRERLGLAGGGKTDILNLKCGPVMAGSLAGQSGILPAYHMQKGSWISVLLDGSVDMGTIEMLLEISYDATAVKKRSSSQITGPRQWLIPANPGYFDLERAFAQSDIIMWKQSSRVSVGDTVYIYVAKPDASVRYKCTAIEVDIPREYADENVRMKKTMRLRLTHRFRQGRLSREFLSSHGVTAVRGPRGIPNSLLRAMEDAEREDQTE